MKQPLERDIFNVCTFTQVSAYMERSFGHPLLKSATYTWPGYLPSPYLTSLLRREVGQCCARQIPWTARCLNNNKILLKAGLVAAEKNQVAVVLVSMVCGPGLGVWELGRYLIRSSFFSCFLSFFVILFTQPFLVVGWVLLFLQQQLQPSGLVDNEEDVFCGIGTLIPCTDHLENLHNIFIVWQKKWQKGTNLISILALAFNVWVLLNADLETCFQNHNGNSAWPYNIQQRRH